MEIDNALSIMPPPITSTIPIGLRRTSASSTILSESIAQLKTELMDENSSHSASDSLDCFPVVVPNTIENIGNLDHGFHNVCKQNLTVMDMRSLPMLQNSNFSTQQQMIQRESETVGKFISNITSTMAPNNEPSIADFVHAAAVAAAVSDPPVQVHLIPEIAPPQSDPTTSLEINTSQASSTSSQSSTNVFDSPISHDIILNSNSAASLLINATSSATSQQVEHIASDIINNSSVAPSVLCPQTSRITLNEVAMATSYLSDIAGGQTQNQVTTNIINNIIGGNTSTQQQVVGNNSAMNVMISLAESQSNQVSQILSSQAPVLNSNTLVNMLHQQQLVPTPNANTGFLDQTLPVVQIDAMK